MKRGKGKLYQLLNTYERIIIETEIKRAGSVTGAAESLGLHRNSLYKCMARLGMPRNGRRSGAWALQGL